MEPRIRGMIAFQSPACDRMRTLTRLSPTELLEASCYFSVIHLHKPDSECNSSCRYCFSVTVPTTTIAFICKPSFIISFIPDVYHRNHTNIVSFVHNFNCFLQLIWLIHCQDATSCTVSNDIELAEEASDGRLTPSKRCRSSASEMPSGYEEHADR